LTKINYKWLNKKFHPRCLNKSDVVDSNNLTLNLFFNWELCNTQIFYEILMTKKEVKKISRNCSNFSEKAKFRYASKRHLTIKVNKMLCCKTKQSSKKEINGKPECFRKYSESKILKKIMLILKLKFETALQPLLFIC